MIRVSGPRNAHIFWIWFPEERQLGVRVEDEDEGTTKILRSLPLPEGTPLRNVVLQAFERLEDAGYMHGGDFEKTLEYCRIAYTGLGLPWEEGDEERPIEGRSWS